MTLWLIICGLITVYTALLVWANHSLDVKDRRIHELEVQLFYRELYALN